MAAKSPFANNLNNEEHKPVWAALNNTNAFDTGKKMKGLIYMDANIPKTPPRAGRRAPTGGHISTSLPYAKDTTSPFRDNPANCALPSSLRRTRPVNEKVSLHYGATEYADNILEKRYYVDAGRARNHIGHGDILGHHM